MISNAELRRALLPPAMLCYFEAKLPTVDPTEVGVRVEETLKFLNMAWFLHGEIPVSQELDDIWHLWILETREYARLCRSLAGGNVIHHSSNTFSQCSGSPAPPRTVVGADQQDLQRRTQALSSYVRNYGPFEADRIRYWPFAHWLVRTTSMSLAELNAFLSAEPDHVRPESGLAQTTHS